MVRKRTPGQKIILSISLPIHSVELAGDRTHADTQLPSSNRVGRAPRLPHCTTKKQNHREVTELTGQSYGQEVAERELEPAGPRAWVLGHRATPPGHLATGPPCLDAQPQGHPAWTLSHRATPPGRSATGPPHLGARPQGHPACALGRGATPPDQHEHVHTTQAGSRLINLSQGNICDELCSSSDASVNCTRVRGCYAGKKGEAHGRRGLLQGP